MRRRPFRRFSVLVMLVALAIITGMSGRAQVEHQKADIRVDVQNVPEPSRALLMMTGLATLMLRRRR